VQVGEDVVRPALRAFLVQRVEQQHERAARRDQPVGPRGRVGARDGRVGARVVQAHGAGQEHRPPVARVGEGAEPQARRRRVRAGEPRREPAGERAPRLEPRHRRAQRDQRPHRLGAAASATHTTPGIPRHHPAPGQDARRQPVELGPVVAH
jgi:hypothetical protein